MSRRGSRDDSGKERGTAAAPPSSPQQLIDALASAVVFADRSDGASMAHLKACLERVNTELSPTLPSAVRVGLDSGEAMLLGPDADASINEAISSISEALDLLGSSAAASALDPPPAAPAPIASAPAAAPPAVSAGPRPVQRDEDTISLFGDFLAESGDLLASADGVLMRLEREGADAEKVNLLFRVFHTIKGIAGLLDLHHITGLAHSVESMLDRCRSEGQHQLTGTPLDVVFDSTAMLRRMIDEVRPAVEHGVECLTVEDIPALLARIAEASAGAWQPGSLPPPCAPAAQSVEPPLFPLPVATAPAAPVAPAPLPAAAATPVPAAEPARGAEVKLRDTIKVDLERVDSLVEMIGELVVVEAQVVGSPEIAQLGSLRVRNCLAQLAKVTRDLQDVGMRMRMVPLSGVFQKMDRLVRDLAKRTDKQVRIVMSGESTEMDRTLVEQIADPLVHMIRNAVDHGLETPDERRAKGKPPEGTVRLAAYAEGSSCVIEVSDDGRGLDRDGILRKARAQGLIGGSDQLADEEVYELIFAPGLSTASKVTEVSGRGVGMDVVKRNIEALHGRVMIQSEVGKGTVFKIVLPLTLAIIDGMLVSCGAERYVIPTLSIVESIQPDPSMLVSYAGSAEMLNLRGQILPLVRLDRLFSLAGACADPTHGIVVVIEGLGSRVGLLVDEVVSQQQVVIKTLGSGLGVVRFIAGAAILADGRVGLILNVEDIANIGGLRAARGRADRAEVAPPTPKAAADRRGQEVSP